MKKFIIISVSIILVVALGIFIYINSFSIIIPQCENAEIVFVYNDENIHAKVSKEDTEQLLDIINNYKKLYIMEPFEIPSCGFDKNISFCFGNAVFSPACDTCSLIKHKGKYFDVSESDINKIHKIMEKYGAHFPCV